VGAARAAYLLLRDQRQRARQLCAGNII
jgi:hypothetical protein